MHKIHLHQGKVSINTLTQDAKSALTVLASDARIWTYERIPYHQPMVFQRKWFAKAMAQMEEKKRWSFSVLWDGKLAGSSSYYDIDPKNKCLNIGYTWYHPKFWGAGLNVTAKFLLLRYAFEELAYVRVAFSVDRLNRYACQALEKLGAQREGILHKHLLRDDGTSRDSVVFAITDDDWLMVKDKLQKMIDV